jgi:hypothetical protein
MNDRKDNRATKKMKTQLLNDFLESSFGLRASLVEGRTGKIQNLHFEFPSVHRQLAAHSWANFFGRD